MYKLLSEAVSFPEFLNSDQLDQINNYKQQIANMEHAWKEEVGRANTLLNNSTQRIAELTKELNDAKNLEQRLRTQIDELKHSGNASNELIQKYESNIEALKVKQSILTKDLQDIRQRNNIAISGKDSEIASYKNQLSAARTDMQNLANRNATLTTQNQKYESQVQEYDKTMRNAYNTQLDAFKNTRSYKLYGDKAIPDSLKDYESFKNTVNAENGIDLTNFNEKVVKESGQIPISSSDLKNAFNDGKTIDYVKAVIGQSYENHPGTVITAGILGTALLAAGAYGLYRQWKKYRERKKAEILDTNPV